MQAKSEDHEIASHIRNAMSHLRAGSLPAALVRPNLPETDDSDAQVSLQTLIFSEIHAQLLDA